MRLRFNTRTLLCLVTLACVVAGLFFLRGVWLLDRFERTRSKEAWHALLEFNGSDSQLSHLRGKPLGYWRTNQSRTSVGWLVTRHKGLTAVSAYGKILDWGGIACNGTPRAVWTGVTPNGKSSIILVSNTVNPDGDYYVLFVSLHKNCRVQRMIVLDSANVKVRVNEWKGWPTVELESAVDNIRETFSFPESGFPSSTGETNDTRPWQVSAAHDR